MCVGGGGVRAKITLLRRCRSRVWGLGPPFPSPSPRQTDRQTGEAGHREDSERWIGDKLKESRQNSSSFPHWDPPHPLPSFSLPPNTHKFKTYKGRTGDRGQYRSEKKRRPGVEVSMQNSEARPHLPTSPEPSPGLPRPSSVVSHPPASMLTFP